MSPQKGHFDKNMSPQGFIFEYFTVCLQVLKESNKTSFDSYSH